MDKETGTAKPSVRDLFEKGFAVEVRFDSGKVSKTRDDGTGEPQDFSHAFQGLAKAGIFRDADNSYSLKFDSGRLELAFERTEEPDGAVFRITVADNARRLLDILVQETFEDLRYTLGSGEAELFRNGMRYETVKVKDTELDERDGVLRRTQNFYSLEGPEFGTASFRVANTANVTSTFTVRRLGSGFSFIDTYGDDLVFIKFFSRVLSGNGTNRSILVSGGTNQGKTSVLISLMNFINTYSLSKVYKHMYIRRLSKIRPEYATLSPDKVTKQYLEEQIRQALPPDEAQGVIAGTAEYVRKSGLDRLITAFSGRSVFSIEKPIEKRFSNDSLSFTQTDISFDDRNTDDKNAFGRGRTLDEISTQKFLLQSQIALQSNPSLLYLSELKAKEEYEKYLEIILQAIPTLATNHSGSIWQNLERIMAVFQDEKSPKQSIIGGMGGLMNFRRYVADDDSFLFSYEYLILTDDMLTRFRNNSVKEFEKTVTTVIIPDEYVRHEYSLVRQLFERYRKSGTMVGIRTFGMPEYADLMSEFNIGKAAKLYGLELSEMQGFQLMYLEEMGKREDLEA